MESIILELYNKNIIKYGKFILKSGIESEIYFNLRELIGYPHIMKKINKIIYTKFKNLSFNQICGLPYTGIPIASDISIKYNIPMLIIRKERKEYGTKQLIEGVYNDGDKCLLIDDLITTGSSIREYIKMIRDEGIRVKDIVVFINRCEDENMINELENELEIKIHYVIKMEEIIEYINNYNEQRKKYMNDLTIRLANIINKKQCGICFSADINDPRKILKMVKKIGTYICMLKLHIDIINFKSLSLNKFIKKLLKYKLRYNFCIMEDRKFSDIGSTVYKQLFNDEYKIYEWADYITVHSIMGYGTLESLKSYKGGIFLISQASSHDNLIDDDYTNKTIELAKKYNKNVVGFISQNNYGIGEFLYAKPGINLEYDGDENGQKYTNKRNNCDIIIVGRGLYESKNIKKSILEYKNLF